MSLLQIGNVRCTPAAHIFVVQTTNSPAPVQDISFAHLMSLAPLKGSLGSATSQPWLWIDLNPYSNLDTKFDG